MRFVNTAWNLWLYVFGIKLIQSLYDAIATMNVIVAGLQVLQMFHVLQAWLYTRGDGGRGGEAEGVKLVHLLPPQKDVQGVPPPADNADGSESGMLCLPQRDTVAIGQHERMNVGHAPQAGPEEGAPFCQAHHNDWQGKRVRGGGGH
jgi:hypothetical protein